MQTSLCSPQLLIQLLAVYRGLPADAIESELREAQRTLQTPSITALRKWVTGETLSFGAQGAKFFSAYLNENKAAYRLSKSQIEGVTSGSLFQTIKALGLAYDQVYPCLPADLQKVMDWSRDFGGSARLPSRTYRQESLGRIKRNLCGLYYLYRKRSSASGLVREIIHIEDKFERFTATYYYATGQIWQGQAVFSRNAIYFLFSIKEENDLAANFMSVQRKDRVVEHLCGIGCSMSRYGSTDPGSRRIVLRRIPEDSQDYKDAKEEIDQRSAGTFQPGTHDHVTILRPTEQDSIKYYAAVENHTNTTRARDFIHLNSDQFMNECIQQGERFWALFQELTTNLTGDKGEQARLNRMQDLNANQMYELLEKLDGQGVASVLS